MKKTEHSVYSLINSLTDKEYKAFVAILKKQKSNSNYVTLCKQIRMQTARIRSGKKDNKEHVLNTQLEEKVIAFMVSNAEHNIIDKMHSMIASIDILIHRNLYDAANKYITKGKDEALKARNTLYYKMFIRYEGIILKQVHKKDPVKAINDYIETIKVSDRMEQESMEGLIFQQAVYVLLDSSHYVRGQHAEAILKEIGNNSIVKTTDITRYDDNRMHQWMGVITYKMLSHKLEDAVQMQLLLYNHYANKKNEILKSRPDIFIGIIANTVTVAYKAKKYELASKFLDELLLYTVAPYPRNSLTTFFYLLYKANCEFVKNKDITYINKLHEFIIKEKNNLRPDALFNGYITIAQSNLSLKNYSLAKSILGDLVEHKDNSEIYSERNGIFKLLYMIAFYEELEAGLSQDYLHFESTLAGFYDYVRKRDGFELELSFIRFFKKAKPFIDRKKRTALLKKLRSDVEEIYLADSLFIRHIKHDYELLEWIDEKLTNFKEQ